MNRGTHKDYFTTGEVCELLQVAPRTVAKWFDRGHMKGVYLPGHGSDRVRRIHRDSLVEFMQRTGFVVPPELCREKVVLLVSRDSRLGACLMDAVGRATGKSILLRTAKSAVKAGWRYVEAKPALVIADASIGRSDALELLADIRETAACVCLLGVINEDETRKIEWDMGPRDLFQRPFDPELLVARVKELLVPEAKETKNARHSA